MVWVVVVHPRAVFLVCVCVCVCVCVSVFCKCGGYMHCAFRHNSSILLDYHTCSLLDYHPHILSSIICQQTTMLVQGPLVPDPSLLLSGVYEDQV